MPTITTATNGCMLNTPRRTYISGRVFNDAFYKLVGPDDNGLYSLNGVTGATAGNCPQGRVLRENGKKVYPDQYKGVSIYLVGVYDEQSFLSGFINPNSPSFAVLNTDMPTYLTSIPGEGGAEDTNGLPNKGNAVYTRGDVIADGNLVVNDVSGVGSTVGGDLEVGGNLDVSGSISFNFVALTLTANATTTYNFGANKSTFYKVSMTPSAGGETQTIATTTFLPENSIVYMEFINTPNFATTVAFGAGFNTTASISLAANATPGTTKNAVTVIFICNSSKFHEISRSGAVVSF